MLHTRSPAPGIESASLLGRSEQLGAAVQPTRPESWLRHLRGIPTSKARLAQSQPARLAVGVSHTKSPS